MENMSGSDRNAIEAAAVLCIPSPGEYDLGVVSKAKSFHNRDAFESALLLGMKVAPGTYWFNGTDKACVTQTAIRWYRCDLYHRDNGPAIEDYLAGTKIWYCRGQRHRDDGPAATYRGGDFTWFRHGMVHREDGPAKVVNGRRSWYLNGKRVKAFTE